ncbi:MAG TPA: hypothetical protein ENJ80_11550 [Gammaproteobacteria bacterium]|nr:hypothetical protein [Gammaproteobacteria bacterium]
MKRLLFLMMILPLAACQQMALQHDEGVPVSVRVDDAAYWLEEWHRVIALPDEQLKQTLEARKQEFERAANPRTRLRLALLLAEGPKAVRNQSEALKLLKGLDTSKASDSAQALAALLVQIIGEQYWSGDKISEIRAKLKQSEARVEELERQLQELTTIEQNIQQRETPN